MIKFELRQKLKENNMSIYAFSKALEISYPTAHKMAKGEVSLVKLTTLDEICTLLNCTPNDILIFTNEKGDN